MHEAAVATVALLDELRGSTSERGRLIKDYKQLRLVKLEVFQPRQRAEVVSI